MANKRLDDAKRNKADEFYTQLVDIELEMKHYRDQFKGKTVFCNCDEVSGSVTSIRSSSESLPASVVTVIVI